MFYACVALKRGDVDGVVGGAEFSSADVSRAAFQVIKAAPGISSVSSCFVMVPPEDFKYKKYPAYIFSDCAVIPYPTSDQLADIVVAAADSAKKICEMDPKIAMLSFSTKGSANHESVEKVRVAYQKVKEEHPEIDVDGELQLDASLVDSVANQKGTRQPRCRQSKRSRFPQPRCRQHRLQDRTTLWQLHGNRTYHARSCSSRQRFEQRLRGRGHRGCCGNHGSSIGKRLI